MKTDEDLLNQYTLLAASELAESVRTQDRECEKRVQFFLALASGTIALVALLTKNDGKEYENLRVPLGIALSILFVFGIATLHRLNWRVIYRNQNDPIGSRLRKHISDKSELFKQIHEIQDKSQERIKNANWWVRTVRGSLAEFMYIANSLLVAALSFLVCEPAYQITACIVFRTLAVFFLTGIALFGYCHLMKSIMPEGWYKPRAQNITTDVSNR